MDEIIFHIFNNLAGKTEFFDAFIFFSAVFLAWWLGAALIAGLFFLKTRFMVFEALVAAFISRFVVADGIRLLYNRPRPFSVVDAYQLIAHDPSYAFPSGHATFFFALATTVFLYNKRWGMWFFVAVLLMTLARVAGGIHWPSDILAGALIGIFIAFIIHIWAIKFGSKQKRHVST